jgi:hypothetical protein
MVLEVKSTYLRHSLQYAWPQETTTLRRAGQQLHPNVAAVQRRKGPGSIQKRS